MRGCHWLVSRPHCSIRATQAAIKSAHPVFSPPRDDHNDVIDITAATRARPTLAGDADAALTSGPSNISVAKKKPNTTAMKFGLSYSNLQKVNPNSCHAPNLIRILTLRFTSSACFVSGVLSPAVHWFRASPPDVAVTCVAV